MIVSTKKSEYSNKWLSNLGKRILILSENGTTISKVVNILQKNYNNKQTCWAAISRACKKLSNKNLLKLFKKNNRVNSIRTTIHGKKLIRQHCTDLEILSLKQNIAKIQQKSKKIKSKSDIDNIKDNQDVQKLILEVLARYGELDTDGICFCIKIPNPLVREILDEMVKTSLIMRINENDTSSTEKFLINWKYLFLPLKSVRKK
ncbi:MAG: hypothetical protein GF329_10915 [Candidatus Lokiarchaeota archaeon]|nr:hypothetical protein [Candidatus Lokiarchaeota archaeon]